MGRNRRISWMGTQPCFTHICMVHTHYVIAHVQLLRICVAAGNRAQDRHESLSHPHQNREREMWEQKTLTGTPPGLVQPEKDSCCRGSALHARGRRRSPLGKGSNGSCTDQRFSAGQCWCFHGWRLEREGGEKS